MPFQQYSSKKPCTVWMSKSSNRWSYLMWASRQARASQNTEQLDETCCITKSKWKLVTRGEMLVVTPVMCCNSYAARYRRRGFRDPQTQQQMELRRGRMLPGIDKRLLPLPHSARRGLLHPHQTPFWSLARLRVFLSITPETIAKLLHLGLQEISRCFRKERG